MTYPMTQSSHPISQSRLVSRPRLTRYHGINQKGLVDESISPKLSELKGTLGNFCCFVASCRRHCNMWTTDVLEVCRACPAGSFSPGLGAFSNKTCAQQLVSTQTSTGSHVRPEKLWQKNRFFGITTSKQQVFGRYLERNFGCLKS